jgi:predicted DNA-binding helix-hairpin-helix protein
MNTAEKLDILSRDAQYDLSCACSTKNPDEHRKRSSSGSWLYPVTVAGGGSGIMLKTLISNACANDCRYCPLRAGTDTPRITLQPDELARFFLQFQAKRPLVGLFLSSGVISSPDYTMDRLIGTAEILRNQYRYRGYIHIKIIPGSSHAAIDRALDLASAVSLNIEVPGAIHAAKLSQSKRYEADIINGLTYISAQTAKGSPHEKVTKTSQFIVGASDEHDREILSYTWNLYRKLHINRLYFSAYQKGLGEASIPGEIRSPLKKESYNQLMLPGFLPAQGDSESLLREHRLYQVDYLFRSYGFSFDELVFDSQGDLPLTLDPKTMWAQQHPQYFPVSLSRGSQRQLLRVPGIGPTLAQRIVNHRKQSPLGSLEDLHMPRYLMERARNFLQR